MWDRSFNLPQLALDRDGDNALLRSYRYGHDLVSQTAGASTFYYHNDGLGSVADVTSSTGASQRWSEYYPYGLAREAGGTSPPVQPFRFTGEQLDSLTGLYHLRARQYDPSIGRFLTVDPIESRQTDPLVAGYGYARNNPNRWADPNGKCVQTLAAAFAGPPGAVAGGGAFLFCVAVVALGGAAIGATTTYVAQNPPDIDLSGIRYPDSEPVYDPRPDPGTTAGHLELQRRLSGEDGGFGSPGLPSWCVQHKTKCAAYVGVSVAVIDAIIIAATHGRDIEAPVQPPGAPRPSGDK